MDDSGQRLTRRRTLELAGTTVAVTLAGCSDGTGGGTPTPTGGSSDAQLLPPPVKGNPDAAVTLEVFEDYACPHCADYNVEGLPEIESAYISPGKIRYEHRDLPIPVADPGSWQAANAARAVQDRQGDGAFWTYAAALFERSRAIATEGPDLFASLADQQGLDGAAVREAATGRVYRATVRRDRQRAVDLGVEATPAFVLNGEIVASGFGPETVGTLRSALDGALSETG